MYCFLRACFKISAHTDVPNLFSILNCLFAMNLNPVLDWVVSFCSSPCLHLPPIVPRRRGSGGEHRLTHRGGLQGGSRWEQLAGDQVMEKGGRSGMEREGETERRGWDWFQKELKKTEVWFKFRFFWISFQGYLGYNWIQKVTKKCIKRILFWPKGQKEVLVKGQSSPQELEKRLHSGL